MAELTARRDVAPERRGGPTIVSHWLPVALWMVLVFFFSSLSRLGALGRVPDWISHPLEYGLGAVLVGRALAGGFARPLPVRLAVATVLLVTAYGVSDEYHQSFVPGRDADPLDVVKDCAGASLAAAALRRWGPRVAAFGERSAA
jgi:VanZ like protein